MLIEEGTLLSSVNGKESNFTITSLESVPQVIVTAKVADETWGKFRSYLIDKYVLPFLDGLDENAQLELFLKHSGEDADWNWVKKAAFWCNSDEYTWFTLKSDNSQIEAILIAYHPKKSILENGDVFYIDYLATAPWNRNTPNTKKEFSGIGTKLIKAVARYYSETVGIKPGFLLHSLPGAKGFYKSIGMQELGIDCNKEDLMVFEMMSQDCSNFLKQGGGFDG